MKRTLQSSRRGACGVMGAAGALLVTRWCTVQMCNGLTGFQNRLVQLLVLKRARVRVCGIATRVVCQVCVRTLLRGHSSAAGQDGVRAGTLPATRGSCQSPSGLPDPQRRHIRTHVHHVPVLELVDIVWIAAARTGASRRMYPAGTTTRAVSWRRRANTVARTHTRAWLLAPSTLHLNFVCVCA